MITAYERFLATVAGLFITETTSLRNKFAFAIVLRALAQMIPVKFVTWEKAAPVHINYIYRVFA